MLEVIQKGSCFFSLLKLQSFRILLPAISQLFRQWIWKSEFALKLHYIFCVSHYIMRLKVFLAIYKSFQFTKYSTFAILHPQWGFFWFNDLDNICQIQRAYWQNINLASKQKMTGSDTRQKMVYLLKFQLTCVPVMLSGTEAETHIST